MVNFSMYIKMKLLWRATCLSYDVIKQLSKLHKIVEYSFLFPLMQEL